MRPSKVTKHPFDSVLQKSESETIAQNIMIILKRTGDVFRKLSFNEYKKERLKDGNYSDSEKEFFDQVVNYCKSSESAKQFSKTWNS